MEEGLDLCSERGQRGRDAGSLRFCIKEFAPQVLHGSWGAARILDRESSRPVSANTGGLGLGRLIIVSSMRGQGGAGPRGSIISARAATVMGVPNLVPEELVSVRRSLPS